MTQRLEGHTLSRQDWCSNHLYGSVVTQRLEGRTQLTGLVFKSSLWECSDTAVRRSDSVDRTGVPIILMGV